MKAARFGFSINVDRHGPLSLQQQVRQRIIDALSHGVLRPGRRLPSTRLLAAQTGLSRNTITLAYDALLAEGHLESRARSGIYVPANAPVERVTTGRRGLRAGGHGWRTKRERKRRPWLSRAAELAAVSASVH